MINFRTTPYHINVNSAHAFCKINFRSCHRLRKCFYNENFQIYGRCPYLMRNVNLFGACALLKDNVYVGPRLRLRLAPIYIYIYIPAGAV